MKHRFTALAALAFMAACGEAPTEPATTLDVAPAFDSQSGSTYYYVDWTAANAAAGTATGTITLPGGATITVNLRVTDPNGPAPLFGYRVNGVNEAGIAGFAPDWQWNNWWTYPSTAPYVSGEVLNAPGNGQDIIALAGGSESGHPLSSYVITFEPAVQDPIMAILSLGAGGNPAVYDFDRPFQVLSQGTGRFGGGSTSLTALPGEQLQGYEGNGTIRFTGSFSTFSWTVPDGEIWHGFTVGVRGAADPNFDSDADGLPDASDNCPLVPNASQIDSDYDGIGDACDSANDGGQDSDGDGLTNAYEHSIGTSPTNPDTDGDGVGDKNDEFPTDPTRSADTSNPVVNGSFERPVIGVGPWPLPPNTFPWQTFTTAGQGLTGWVVESSTVDTQSGEVAFQFTGVPDGRQVLDMNNGSIRQTIATTPNHRYRVSFSLSKNYVCVGGNAAVSVSFGGSPQSFTFAGGGSAQNMQWDAHSFEAVTQGSSTDLRFKATLSGGCGGPMIDKVRVEDLGPADDTPPSITPNVSGTLNGDWYTSDVDVSWTVTDDESAITSTSGCDATSVTSDTQGVTFTCSATSEGGTASASVTIQRDATPPTVAPTVSGTLGENGWYTSDVSVSWTVTEPTSPMTSSGCDATSVTSDTQGVTFTCSATSAGGTASESVTIKRDATAPEIAFSGNAGSYTVDQTIAITCSATDAMSGIASSTCPGAAGDAYTFALGTHTLSASAMDYAGLLSSASTQFTVSVTSGSLCTLVQRWVSNAGVANSMCQQLANRAYGAFINHVKAQGGKKFLAADKAAILIDLAGRL